jgi:hypothetical protein
MPDIHEKAVIRGSGFNPNGGGFAELIINGRVYPADQVVSAINHYELPVADTTEFHRLKAFIWKRDSTEEWVLELSGAINDTFFINKHTEPLHVAPEDVAGLPSLYKEELSVDYYQNVIDKLINAAKRQNEIMNRNSDFYDQKWNRIFLEIKNLIEIEKNSDAALFEEHSQLRAEYEREFYFEASRDHDIEHDTGFDGEDENALAFLLNESTTTASFPSQQRLETEVDCIHDDLPEVTEHSEKTTTSVANDDLEADIMNILLNADTDLAVKTEHLKDTPLSEFSETENDSLNDNDNQSGVNECSNLCLTNEEIPIYKMLHTDEKQSWIDYVRAEQLSFEGKYGLNPVSINNWQPRIPFSTWLSDTGILQ